MRFLRAFLCLILMNVQVQAQEDSVFDKKNLEEIVITATRTERKLGNVAVPVAIISRQLIKQTGAIRLQEALQEQTGIQLNAGTGSAAIGGGIFGNGVQLQGLSPDYTLILLDGEPVIGRQGGVLDLSRFVTGNIKRIEIVKGPSSSLYGSEAMAGVINIITEQPSSFYFEAGSRYGSFNGLDMYVAGNGKAGKTNLYYFANRNSSDGYDLDKSTAENSVDPYQNYTGQLKLSHRFSANTTLLVNTRYNYGRSKNYYAIGNKEINISGRSANEDYNINPVLKHQFSERINTTFRFYGSGYVFDQRLDSLENGQAYYRDDFRQQFWRVEDQTDIKTGRKHLLSVGGGYVWQTVNTNRYSKRQKQEMYYAFAQDDWQPSEKINIISGLRYDHNADFASHLSPKLALRIKATPRINLTASYGAGFKAPDFRQLYLNFTNNAAQGYTIYGTAEFSVAELERLKEAGLIEEILPAALHIKKLKPEISNGFNIGAAYTGGLNFNTSINLFYNNIRQLINSIPVAINPNGSQVYSYINVANAFTRGGELSMQYWFQKHFIISGGYQYLETGDVDTKKQVREGKVYGRDSELGTARKMTLHDYSGLLQRSKHMANAKLFYNNEKKGWDASLRANWRSRWGAVDKDGNGFANMDEEFAKGFVQVNMTAGYRFAKNWSGRLGINNLLNHTDAKNLVNMPGINFFAAVNFLIKK